jgi:5,5'-dehydrodivanillate O-demethylase
MLSREDNERLTRVAPGTPMGELMRRYWHPVAAVAELDQTPIKKLRLLGEDLVLYRDRSGRYGLVDGRCPHRRADLAHGFVDERGIRCSYHGWHFDHTGACLAIPFADVTRPDSRLRQQVRIRAYGVEAKAGLLFAYLGPDPAPLVPDWDFYHRPGYKQIAFTLVPCNWLQCQENSIDPVHLEWLHERWTLEMAGRAQQVPRHLKVRFEEFEYGFTYHRVFEDTDEEHDLWTIGRVCLWPHALFTDRIEWRVPIDDENTLSVAWLLDPLPGGREHHQDRIPFWHSPLRDPETGRLITSHQMNQDFAAWLGQGVCADRTREHLTESDEGIVMIRRRFLEEMRKLEATGGDPKGTIRDADSNDRIRLPYADRSYNAAQRAGRIHMSADEHTPPGAPLYGQPEEIIAEMKKVWGALRGC